LLCNDVTNIFLFSSILPRNRPRLHPVAANDSGSCFRRDSIINSNNNSRKRSFYCSPFCTCRTAELKFPISEIGFPQACSFSLASSLLPQTFSLSLSHRARRDRAYLISERSSRTFRPPFASIRSLLAAAGRIFSRHRRAPMVPDEGNSVRKRRSSDDSS